MSRSVRHRLARVAALPVAVASFAAAAPLLAPAPAHAGTYLGELAFGPLSTLKTMGNVDLAPDGSGAVVYLVEEGGTDRVFVSRLVDGAWKGPERLDGGLPGSSSQPIVSAGDDGRLSVVFANGGNIYAVTRKSLAEGWTTQPLWTAGGASDPYVDLSVNRKGYAVFAAPGPGGHDVRVAYSRDAGPWTLVGAPLDADVNRDAGVGGGRARVASSADGSAVVAWGESGRVHARRVVKTRPSVVAPDATAGAAVEGVEPVAADLPEIGIQDDSSFTGLAFRAHYQVNGAARTRAVYRRLRGSRFEGTTAVDAAPFGSGQGSTAPRISTGGIGQGLVVGSNDATNITHALQLRADVQNTVLMQVDSIAQSVAPTYAVPATATPLKQLVVWQYTDANGGTDVRGRFFNGRDFEAEQVLSAPGLGATDAARGLDAAGDDNGDLVATWVQGNAIAVATIDQPPGRIAPKARAAGFERTNRPVLEWTRSREAWGAQYRVTVDGAEIATTPRTSLRPATALADGAHSWQVTVVDRRGQTFAGKTGTVRVDTVAPTASARISGARRLGATLRLALTARDAPPPPAKGARPAQTSGVAQAIVDWGDRTRRERLRTAAQHVYARPGSYTVLVTVLDKAGNRTVVRQQLRVAAPPRRAARGRGRGAR